MSGKLKSFHAYLSTLKSISWRGTLYKRLFCSPIIYLISRSAGLGIVEIGSGIGSGVLGAFPSQVIGVDVNPLAVKFANTKGYTTHLINADGSYPFPNQFVYSCVLDNVLEHIEDPKVTLDESWRITKPGGLMIVVVPGVKGFRKDSDHKIFYDQNKLTNLDSKWVFVKLFALPFYFESELLSRFMSQYCIVAIYKKI